MVLGTALGKKDKREGSLSNPKTYTFQYTERDPWYDVFRKAYRKSFRKN